MKRLLPFVIVLITSFRVLAGDGLSTQTISQTKPIAFIENKGQVTDQHYISRNDIDFKLEGSCGLNIFIGSGAIHYQFCKPSDNTHFPFEKCSWLRNKEDQHKAIEFEMYRMDVELLGANRDAEIIKEGRANYHENYYTIGTEKNGVSVHRFSKVTYKEVYPHIDWVLYIKNGQLKHEFVVKENGKVSDIRLKYDGARKMILNKDGSLTAQSTYGEVFETKPLCFTSEGTIVNSAYQLDGDVVSYKVGKCSGVLTIDPGITWGTYYGGNEGEGVYKIAIDNVSNIYLTGLVESISNIATTGTHKSTLSGARDTYIAKFNSQGLLVWATYYGGSAIDDGFDIDVSRSGDIYIAGATSSSNGIATAGAYQTSYWGNIDGFLAKFDSSGIRIWATYFGGTGGDQAHSVNIDGGGNIYITGFTESLTRISTSGAYQTTYSGGAKDGYIAKFNGAGNLIWSTYYGGTNSEAIWELETDDSCNIFFCGTTRSVAGIATTGTHQSTIGSNDGDVFVVKFDSSGSRKWGTYYGGDGTDDVYDLVLDSFRNIYFSGPTRSSNAIATSGAHKLYDSSLQKAPDSYLCKLNNSGNIIWSTYYGGTETDLALDLFMDNSRNVYMAGATNSDSGIATIGFYQSSFGGDYDAFIAKFDSSGTRIWGTYFGGAKFDFGRGIVKDSTGFYFAGTTEQQSGIATTGTHQSVLINNQDCFLVKFCEGASPIAAAIGGADSLCIGDSAKMVNTQPNGVWLTTGNGITSISAQGDVMGLLPGTDSVLYVLNNGCGIDTVWKIIYVLPTPAIINQPVDLSVNSGISASFSINVTGITLSYQWQAYIGSSGYQNITDGGQYSGTNTAMLSVSGTTLANNNNKFRCIVTSNTCDVISDTATLFVWPLGISSVKNEDIHIAPNPTKNIITVTSSNTIEKIDVTNLLGQRMILQEGNSKAITLSLNELIPGIYIIKVNDSYVERVVKE